MSRLRSAATAAALTMLVASVLAACADGRQRSPVEVASGEDGGGAVTFVSLGTDETEASDLDFPASLRAAWPQLVFRTALPRRTVFVNLADTGSTVALALDRQLPGALEIEPTLATVWLTSSDAEAGTAPDTYAADLFRLVQGLQRGGRTRVLVATSTPLDPAPALDAAVERVVAATGADLVDLRDLELAGPDAPNRQDHAVLAEAFARVVGEIR